MSMESWEPEESKKTEIIKFWFLNQKELTPKVNVWLLMQDEQPLVKH